MTFKSKIDLPFIIMMILSIAAIAAAGFIREVSAPAV
ncbi:hypothetical protein BN1048_01215 [Jeotgalicoccus saudimassiliensis]|uniref:Uncharacterized protein n=1 Tax=Jeotgalicoccus saudimassiliensis TaxID=1461582 RepID=A0A078M449_9STAP|nr:hypothetical protein BN1048_01215 [Jeotgalicoccus saudimassiliensis]